MFSRIKSLGLATRIIVLALAVLVTVVVVNYVVFVRGHRAAAEQAMVQKAAAFTAVADEAKNHTASLQAAGSFDSKALLTEIGQLRDSGRSYTESRLFQTIPVVAGWTAAEDAATREDIEFRIASFDARNKANEPQAGTFDHELLRDLDRQVAAGGADVIHRIDRQSNTLHYMRAIRLTQECMMCHGDPKVYDADGDGVDPAGFKMEGWKPGDTHGAYHVVMPLAPVDKQVAGFISDGLMWTVPLVAGGVFAFVFVLRMIFGRPVKALIERLKDIAQGEGDLTQRIPVNSGDEVGQLGKWFNIFVAKIHDLIVEVSGVTREVASAATEIAASAEEMAQGMNEQTSQMTQISSAVEQMSASVVEVARKSGEAANHAQASGDVARSGGDVVTQTITGMQAIDEAVSASAASVSELGRRGEQIGAIIEVINDIADQTNLLALNAAIEAARAGEAGRGFAVVADEVRKLADRTTKATEEIAQSIQAIQGETGQAVQRMNTGTEQVKQGVDLAMKAGDSLRQIVDSTGQVATMIQSIAAAAEQQSAAAEQVSRNIEQISAVAEQSSEATQQSASAASQLSTKAEQLQAMVNRFKTDAAAVETAGRTGGAATANPTGALSVGNRKLREAARTFKPGRPVDKA